MTCSLLKALSAATAPLVTPVIHVQDASQALHNLDVLSDARCPGAFLINHDFDMATFLPILREVRRERPDLWLGINFLAQPGDIAFPVLGDLARDGCVFDAYWADDACIDERQAVQTRAETIAQARRTSDWHGSYFGGVAFKKQRPVAAEDYAKAAQASVPYLDVVTTSGVATGHAADREKIQTFRSALDTAPLALASGVTPENVTTYAEMVDIILVATGINAPGDFYNIDPDRLSALQTALRQETVPK